MCEKCVEIDRRIGRLNTMIELIADPQTVEAAKSLIEEMNGEKSQLHPERK